jgi:hypothetical protein
MLKLPLKVLKIGDRYEAIQANGDRLMLLTEKEAEQVVEAVNNTARIAELESALTEAVDLIKQWHNMDTAGLLTKAQHEITWKIYQEKAPEMQRINAALAKGKTLTELGIDKDEIPF